MSHDINNQAHEESQENPPPFACAPDCFGSGYLSAVKKLAPHTVSQHTIQRCTQGTSADRGSRTGGTARPARERTAT